jgi:DNA-binding transcriptional LysR family regulator
VLHDWCLRGLGLAWRSTWEVEPNVAAGRLVVLEEFAAPPNGIYAVFPQRKHLPLRVRLWIDFIKHSSRPGCSFAGGARWTPGQACRRRRRCAGCVAW